MTQSREKKSRTMYAGLLAVLLAGAVAWGVSVLADSREAYETSARDFEASRQIAMNVTALRQRLPSSATAPKAAEHDLRKRIAAAAETAGLEPAQLGTIEEQATRRLGDSKINEQPTQVLLREVTLQELIRFLYSATSEAAGVRVTGLRLSAPREQDPGNGWMAEVTMATFVSPVASPPLNGASKSMTP